MLLTRTSLERYASQMPMYYILYYTVAIAVNCTSDLQTNPSLFFNLFKAVISISGVYNLYGLSRSILKQFYLSPAFGNDPATWAMASPCNHITRTKSKHTPPFFVINPKYDFSFLHEDADKFVATLSDNEFRCKRLVTPNRNHLTVMKEFYWKEKPCSGNVEEMSILFIYECEATHK